MTATQYAAIRNALGLTHSALAAVLGVDLRTSQRWEGAERSIPPIVGAVLRLLDQRKLSVADLAAAAKQERLQ